MEKREIAKVRFDLDKIFAEKTRAEWGRDFPETGQTICAWNVSEYSRPRDDPQV